jgi:Zn-dependent peptidase ImmA (M78 family)
MAYPTDPIAELYRRTGVKPPVPSRPIAPLGELIGSFNLMQIELVDLTQKLAASYLTINSGSVTQLDATNEDPLAGFLYATKRQAILFVRHTDLITRRRFSAAHELGHYWLHYVLQRLTAEADDEDEPVIFVDAARPIEMEEADEMKVSGKITKSEVSLSAYEQREYEADIFAARLLMPATLMRALVDRYKPGFEGETLVRRLANELLVSQLAIRIRLHELGLLAQN